MGDSNAEWGQLAQHDDELAEVWDGYTRLPEPGDNEALDALCERKHITIAALVRLGARLAEHGVIAFAFPGGIKYRDMATDRRWAYAGSTWSEMKIVQHGAEPAATVIVAEGETDGAWLSEHTDWDVAILPSGADPRPYAQEYAVQLARYDVVLLGTDDDAAGNTGAALLAELLPQAVRYAPPGANDWCAYNDTPPPVPQPARRVELEILVDAGTILDLEPPDVASWFEGALLPVGGQLVLHGWAKSFKSFLALDMMAALAQGQPWCHFEPTEEPCRVAVMQYEIPWYYFQQRIRFLDQIAPEPELFHRNFMSFTPLRRPTFRAGNTKQEDEVLTALDNAAVQVFLLDPVRRATGAVNMNDEGEVRPLLNFFERLQSNGITVVTCHHDNKTAARQGGGDPLGMTGSGSFSGDCDSIVSVSVPQGGSIDDPKRNVRFTLRNGPAPSPRGFEMGDDGHIRYALEPFGDGMADDTSGPSI